MKLKDYLNVHNLTYQAFALMLKVDPSTVHNWVTGKKKPREKKARQIFERTKGAVSFEDLGLVEKK